MRKITVLAPFALICLSLALVASACGGDEDEEESPFGVQWDLVTEAKRPVAMAFAPDGRLFFAEQHTGNIYVVTADGQLLEEPFAHVDVAAYAEWGLTGLAVDPDFETNRYVYAFFTQLVEPQAPITGRPVIMRFTDTDDRGTDQKVIVGDLPETDPVHHFNANGSIHFGPDGFLYLTLGDYDVGLSQDLSIPQGKMLRVDKEDGSAAPGNPYADDPEADPRIFAYGFRESFDFALHPENGQVYGADNTPGTCEELNLIESGANYGWPDVGEFPWPDCQAGKGIHGVHFFAQGGMVPEKWLSSVLVTGKEFVSGDVYPLLGDGLLVCESKTKLMRRLVLSGANLDQVTADDVIVEDCALDIAVSPDGIIYYSNETEIRRLVPTKQDSS